MEKINVFPLTIIRNPCKITVYRYLMEVDMQTLAIAFTGHRSELLCSNEYMHSHAYFNLSLLIQKEVRHYIDAGCTTFYCGAAQGADILCGEIILTEQKTNNPSIELICVIPFRGQANKWEASWKKRYVNLLCNSNRIIQIRDTYQKGCYHIRNRYLVDHCNVLIAVYNGKLNGGTAYTVKYAQRLGKEVVIIDPNTLEVRRIPSSL